MKANRVQYTVRDVPKSVDAALRKKAREQGKSLNAVLVEALAAKAGTASERVVHTDLDALIGSWVADPAIDAALREQRQVDLRDW
jgi:hypothetical protein